MKIESRKKDRKIHLRSQNYLYLLQFVIYVVMTINVAYIRRVLQNVILLLVSQSVTIIERLYELSQTRKAF